MINVLLVNSPSGVNPPGLTQINVALADQVVSIPDISENNELIGNLVLAPGASMYRFFVPHLGASLNSSSKDSDEGEYYEFSVALTFPFINKEIQKLLKKFKNRDLILIVKDFLGNSYLIGTKEYPAQRNVKTSTGGDSGVNGNQLEFECVSPEELKFFIGEFTLLEQGYEQPAVNMIDFSELDFEAIDFY